MKRTSASWFLLSTVALAANGDPALLRRRVTTSDGVALAVYRYVPEGGGSGRPVLLVPDLGMGREAFDLDGAGFARYLQLHGREAFVVELRGCGASSARPGWRLSEIVARDLPAVAAAVRAAHPGRFDLVVHGYSGALALAAAAKELKGQVERVVALSPAVAPEVPNPIVRDLLTGGGHLSAFAMAGAPFELVFARGGLFPDGRLSAARSAYSDLGAAASADLLDWMIKGDLELPDGTTLKGRLADYDRPTFLVLPLRDNFAHPEFASSLRGLAPRAPIAVRVLDRLERDAEDYSHLSTLLGTEAPADVMAPALTFLNGEEL